MTMACLQTVSFCAGEGWWAHAAPAIINAFSNKVQAADKGTNLKADTCYARFEAKKQELAQEISTGYARFEAAKEELAQEVFATSGYKRPKITIEQARAEVDSPDMKPVGYDRFEAAKEKLAQELFAMSGYKGPTMTIEQARAEMASLGMKPATAACNSVEETHGCDASKDTPKCNGPKTTPSVYNKVSDSINKVMAVGLIIEHKQPMYSCYC